MRMRTNCAVTAILLCWRRDPEGACTQKLTPPKLLHACYALCSRWARWKQTRGEVLLETNPLR